MIKNKYQPSKLMKLSGKFGINRRQITTYAKFFPDLVMRKNRKFYE